MLIQQNNQLPHKCFISPATDFCPDLQYRCEFSSQEQALIQSESNCFSSQQSCLSGNSVPIFFGGSVVQCKESTVDLRQFSPSSCIASSSTVKAIQQRRNFSFSSSLISVSCDQSTWCCQLVLFVTQSASVAIACIVWGSQRPSWPTFNCLESVF